MENTYVNLGISFKDAEAENIENLVMGGAQLDELLCRYQHYTEKEISGIIRRVTQFYFLTDDEAHTRMVDGKEYIVRPVFLGGVDAKAAILKLAEHKTMQYMGFDIPLLDFEKD